jgi:hypothetical protein
MKADIFEDIEKSVMADFDGDGIMDIVIFPAFSTDSPTTTVGAVKFFKGLRVIDK